MRLAAGKFLQPGQAQHFVHSVADFGLGHAFALQAKGDVFPDAQMREQRIGLKHHIGGALVRRHRRHVLTGQKDLSLRGGFKPGKHPHHGGLAAARWAQKRKELFLIDADGQVVDRREITKSFCDVLKLNQRLGLWIVPGFEYRNGQAASPAISEVAGCKPRYQRFVAIRQRQGTLGAPPDQASEIRCLI